jgi:LPS sulfotransferase NodH
VAASSKAILLAHARSGSTLLMRFLDGQPGTSFGHEIFHQQKPHMPGFWPRGEEDEEALKARRDRDPVGFLAEVVARCPTPIFGFKWFRGHTPAIRAHAIAAPDWRCVILYRENFLAVHASQLTARRTGVYLARPGQRLAPPPVLELDPDLFLHEYRLYRRYYDGLVAECDRAGKAFLLIEYQQLQRGAFLRNVARHIGVEDPVTPEVAMVKQGTTRLAERFSNRDALLRTLEGINRLHWLVEEDHFFAPADMDPAAATQASSAGVR